MLARRIRQSTVPTLFTLTLGLGVQAWAGFRGGVREALGPRFEAPPHHRAESKRPPHAPHHRAESRRPSREVGSTSWVRHWNEIAIDASGLDHTPVAPGEDRVFGEQFGPGHSSRAMAIVHVAIFDAVNAIAGSYHGYTRLPRAGAHTSMQAAIAQAAHDALVALLPSQTASFDERLAEDLRRIRDRRARAAGIRLGRRAAAAILAQRADDGSQHPEPEIGVGFFTSDEPGKWRQDPISRIPLALGAFWGGVEPFVLDSADQFRAPPPPTLESPEYAAAFDEAKSLGGDGVVTPTLRTEDQTLTGIYWAYDGTPSLCAPPRLYNQIALEIADQMGSNGVELARLLALVNVAMADAGIAIWESKYFYEYWPKPRAVRAPAS